MDGSGHQLRSAAFVGAVDGGLITPVILCGGSGTRLWPVSRQSYPKQFAPILGDESLFQMAAARFQTAEFAAPMVVTAQDFRFIVTDQLAAAGLAAKSIVIEPEARNTAPAAAAAALILAASDPRALMLIVPSDHLIEDMDLFRAAVDRGAVAARDGRIVTFGIRPDRAETGFGWLRPGVMTHPGVEALNGFVEKPDAAQAESLLADPRCLWNSGIFLARADVLLQAFATHAPDLLATVEASVAGGTADLGFFRLQADAWAGADCISIDYAVMEKARDLAVVRYDGRWSDLGSWAAIWQETPRDEHDTAVQGRATSMGCEGSLLRSDHEGVELIGIGLKNIVAVATRDAVMVADLTQSQSVKLAVDMLKRRGAAQATTFSRDHRPWGWFESLATGDRFQVKRIHVQPGQALSLQSHMHRAEHWIVVQGTARVTVGEEVRLISENQSIYVPLGAKHRLENPGRLPMVLIEVQTGGYLGEDDIIRYEDRYAR
ncbi:MAG: mannose-1-phosphate guanylyltransferase/mannose-6-phosphate isomerase [Tabrizicola sp.]|nr:mannose-1-phosphate guanylyltransferase/mannose-6-phosphate isomerase [Tabrizicola sp.]